MAAPTRFTSGFTQAARWQPLGDIGIPDPFFYAYYEDEFLPYNAALYTVTATGGSVAATITKGSGGRVLFTTGASAGNFAEIQLPVAGLQYTASKKLVYLTRLQFSGVTSAAVIAGLINTTATPFTGGQITDGIYFSEAANSTLLQLLVVTGGVTIGSINIPGVLANNTDLDIGFMVDRVGNIKIFVGNNLEGAKRQNFANLVPDYSIPASSLTGAITTALLNPTLAISNGTTASANTMTSDFQFAAQER